MGQAKQGQGERKDEWWILKEKTNIVLKQKGIHEFMMNINGAACVHDTPSLEWTLRSTASDFLYIISTQEYYLTILCVQIRNHQSCRTLSF